MGNTNTSFEEFKKTISTADDIEKYKLYLKTLQLPQERPVSVLQKLASFGGRIVDVFISASPIIVAIIGGLLTYYATNESNNALAQNTLDLEKTKQQSQLIIDAVKDKSVEQVKSNLEVLQKAKLIGAEIDIQELSRLIYSEKTDSLSQLVARIDSTKRSEKLLAESVRRLEVKMKLTDIRRAESERKRMHLEKSVAEIKELLELTDKTYNDRVAYADSLKKIIEGYEDIITKYNGDPAAALAAIQSKMNKTSGYVKNQFIQQQQQQQQQKASYSKYQQQQQQQQNH